MAIPLFVATLINEHAQARRAKCHRAMCYHVLGSSSSEGHEPAPPNAKSGRAMAGNVRVACNAIPDRHFFKRT
jgi:hypothetical protein